MGKSNFDDLGFEESFDDLGFSDESNTTKSAIGYGKTIQKGLEQGVTLGGADELQGVLGAGIDAGQALLNKLGVMGPSPTQINEQLAKDGFTGDVGPQSFLDEYRRSRDDARKEYKEAAEANPKTSFAANIAGGALLAPLMPSALAAPIGNAPVGANLLQKVGTAAINSLPTGIAAGAGLSDADLTKGEVGKFGKDVGTDAALGMLVSGSLTAAGQGIKGGIDKLKDTTVVKNLLDAYRAAKNGIKLTGPDALKSQHEGLENLGLDARQQLTEFGRTLGTNKSEIIKNATDKTDTRETVKMLKRALKDNDLALTDDDKKLLKGLLTQAEETLSKDSQYADIKNQINKIAKNESISDTNVNNVDKIVANEGVHSDLMNQGVDLEGLINKTFDEMSANKILSPEQQTQLRQLQKQLRKATMDSNPAQIQNVMDKVSDVYGSVSPKAKRILAEFKSNLIGKQNDLVPEVAPINKDISENLSLSEALLDESNLDKMLPDEIAKFQDKIAKKFGKYQTDPTGVQLNTDKILNEGLPTDYNTKTRSLKEINPDFAVPFEKNLKTQSRLLDLSKTANEKVKPGEGVFGTISKSVDSLAVKAGESAGKVVRDNKDLLQRGVKTLADADGNKLQQIGAKMGSMGSKGVEYARVLTEAAGKSSQSKNAIIFGLMQQPEFRELFHKANNIETEDGQ